MVDGLIIGKLSTYEFYVNLMNLVISAFILLHIQSMLKSVFLLGHSIIISIRELKHTNVMKLT